LDIEVLRTLAELPTVVLLIYLLIRAQGQNEKLLAGMLESERNHARNLVEIICSGKINVDANDMRSLQNLTNSQN
jgi:hypothetical protein